MYLINQVRFYLVSYQILISHLEKEKVRFAYFEHDLCDSSECEALIGEFVDRFGGLDVLVNNAGGLGVRKGQFRQTWRLWP